MKSLAIALLALGFPLPLLALDPSCAKLSAGAKPPLRNARSEADWAQWDPKLAAALKSLWQRSVLALGQGSAHAGLDARGTSRRPSAVGPFEASAWDTSDGTFVAFRVPIVPAPETDNASARVERFAGYWADGKLTRLDDRCLAAMDPTHVDTATRVAFGKPTSGDCITARCPLPGREPR